MVVGWGHCGRTITQTQVLRVGVPWSSRAGCVARREKLLAVPTKATAATLGPGFSHLARPGLSKVLRLRNKHSVRLPFLARS